MKLATQIMQGKSFNLTIDLHCLNTPKWIINHSFTPCECSRDCHFWWCLWLPGIFQQWNIEVCLHIRVLKMTCKPTIIQYYFWQYTHTHKSIIITIIITITIIIDLKTTTFALIFVGNQKAHLFVFNQKSLIQNSIKNWMGPYQRTPK